jgi:DNA-binding protein H-NS
MVFNMSNLIEIQSQIEKLQKQATEIKTREFALTVQDILAKMQAFGITVKDLQVGRVRSTKSKGKVARVVKSAPAKAKKKEKSASVVAAKYRGPNGESWSGRGLTPRWLAALLALGKTKDDFAVKS